MALVLAIRSTYFPFCIHAVLKFFVRKLFRFSPVLQQNYSTKLMAYIICYLF